MTNASAGLLVIGCPYPASLSQPAFSLSAVDCDDRHVLRCVAVPIDAIRLAQLRGNGDALLRTERSYVLKRPCNAHELIG
jgi:hypothetical protein